MINRILLICLFWSVLTAKGQDVNLLKKEQPNLKDLFVWGDYIIAEKDYSETERFFICDLASAKLKRLTINGNSQIAGLAETKSKLLAIVKIGKEFYVLSKNKNDTIWKKESTLPEISNIKDTKFAARDDIQILAVRDKIYYKPLAGKWQSVSLGTLTEDKYPLTMPKLKLSACLISSNFLYLGFNGGEWGGALLQIPIDADYTLQKGKVILNKNIIALSLSKEGVLWCATGLAHMGMRESGIYKYDGKTLEKVLWSTSTLSLKQESDLSAFYLNAQNVPFFTPSELGVFKIVNDKLEPVLQKDLYINYEMKDNSVGSHPVAMYVDDKTNIYIASRSLGVFVYTKNLNEYTFTQLTFE